MSIFDTRYSWPAPIGRIGVLLAVLLILSPWQGTLAAPNPRSAEDVVAYLRELGSLQADFLQTVEAGAGEVLQTVHGELYLQRPGRFRWQSRVPYEQTIVADGKSVWIYDVDLEQVTVRPMDEQLQTTPLALLSGSTPLQKAFDVQPDGVPGARSWFRLTPRDGGTEFESIRIAFRDGQIRELELVDALGQTTRLEMLNLKSNPSLAPGLFEFVPPEGADVVGAPTAPQR